MDTQSIQTEGSSAANLKQEKKRSASYPALTVNEAYNFAQRINEKFSSVSELSRDEIATVFDVHPNTISRDIAACVQYGFLGRNSTEGGYKLTDAFNDLFRPESERDRKIGLIMAFGKPKLYADLISKFDGHVIPEELSNTLIKHHSITAGASKDAADTFIKSGREVGVITESRVLKYQVILSSTSKIQYAEVTDVEQPTKQETNLLPVPSADAEIEVTPKEAKKVPIYLTGNKIAWLLYPNDITANDIAIVKHQLEGILLRIQLEAGEKKGESTSPS